MQSEVAFLCTHNSVLCFFAVSFGQKNLFHMSDDLFVKDASSGGALEVLLGQLAEKQGSSDVVKNFGKRMVICSAPR